MSGGARTMFVLPTMIAPASRKRLVTVDCGRGERESVWARPASTAAKERELLMHLERRLVVCQRD